MEHNHPIPGFVWSRKWEAPFEGPYTLLGKLLMATHVRATYMRPYVLCGGPIGKSLLTVDHRGGPNVQPSPVARLLQDACLSPRFGWLAWELADDGSFRYCQACMRHGYQAAVAQITGLRSCPIHRLPYQAACLRCGARTPPYRILDAGLGPRFNCSKCGQSFAYDSQREVDSGQWTTPDGVAAIERIETWLNGFGERDDFRWDDAGDWASTSDIFSQTPWMSRQEAAFRILQIVRPGPVPLVRAPARVWGPYQLGSSESIRQAFAKHLDAVVRDIVPGVDLAPYEAGFLSGNFAEYLAPIDPRVPATAHAVALFRTQFNGGYNVWSPRGDHAPRYFGRAKHLEWLTWFNGASDSPSEGRDLVHGYASAMWCSAVAIARQWSEKLDELRIELGREVQGLDCLPYLAARCFGEWERLSFKPVATIVNGHWRDGPLQIYFAVA